MAWACARTPPAASPAHPDDGQALRAAVNGNRCADEWPVNTAWKQADAIVAVALTADRAVALTESRHIRVWNLKDGTIVVLERDRFSALAADGSTGVTATPLGAGGALLEA